MEQEEKKHPIPKKFRVSLNKKDEAEYALLEKCNEQQKVWAEKVNNPFTQNTPQERARVNAKIMLDTLELVANPSDGQREIMAENYAVLGRYDIAEAHSIKNKAIYRKYKEAVEREDGEWCEHSAKHRFIKDNVFSIKTFNDAPLLACNLCGFLNVADTPDELKDAQKKRAEVRTKIKHSDSIQDLLAQHQRLQR